jgi:hypothetical protein
MGTIGDWGRILTISVLVGLYAWARDMGHKPYINRPGRSLTGWFLLSNVLGIWFTFHWQAFTVPLVLITVPTAVASAVLMYSARPRSAQRAAAELAEDKHK